MVSKPLLPSFVNTTTFYNVRIPISYESKFTEGEADVVPPLVGINQKTYKDTFFFIDNSRISLKIKKGYNLGKSIPKKKKKSLIGELVQEKYTNHPPTTPKKH